MSAIDEPFGSKDVYNATRVACVHTNREDPGTDGTAYCKGRFVLLCSTDITCVNHGDTA